MPIMELLEESNSFVHKTYKLLTIVNSMKSRAVFDTASKEDLRFKAEPGLSEELVLQISKDKNEPEWMLKKRIFALKLFFEKPMPNWGPELTDLDLDKIHLYMRPNAERNSRKWEDVPLEIRKTYEKLGIPEA